MTCVWGVSKNRNWRTMPPSDAEENQLHYKSIAKIITITILHPNLHIWIQQTLPQLTIVHSVISCHAILLKATSNFRACDVWKSYHTVLQYNFLLPYVSYIYCNTVNYSACTLTPPCSCKAELCYNKIQCNTVAQRCQTPSEFHLKHLSILCSPVDLIKVQLQIESLGAKVHILFLPYRLLRFVFLQHQSEPRSRAADTNAFLLLGIEPLHCYD